MKKYVAFILSITLLYIGVQILSGWILTALYTPDISAINTDPGEGTMFQLSPTIQLLVFLFIASLAYSIYQKVSATPSN